MGKAKSSRTLKRARKILITAHGNSLRSLIKHLDNISDKDIVGVNVPTAVPLVYELDENMRPIRSYYLGRPGKRQAEDGSSSGSG